MKFSGKKLRQFFDCTPPQYNFNLFFGPDQGLVQERGRDLKDRFLGDQNHSGNVTEIYSSTIKDDDTSFIAAAHSLSLFGEKQLLLIRDGADSITNNVKKVIENSTLSWPIIVLAGDLSPRSSLRSYFEKHKHCAAVPCYAEEGKDLEALFIEILKEQNLNITKEGLSYLNQFLGGDRMVIRQELTKLSLFTNPAKNGQNLITGEDVISCIVPSTKTSTTDLIFEICKGSSPAADHIFPRLLGQGVSAIQINRALQQHLYRLYFVRSRLDAGEKYEAVLKSLKPPIFFKLQHAFKIQTLNWTLPKLYYAMSLLLECEIQCKKTGTPEDLLCRRTLMRVSQVIRRK